MRVSGEVSAEDIIFEDTNDIELAEVDNELEYLEGIGSFEYKTPIPHIDFDLFFQTGASDAIKE